jgi:hypothetical protein
MADLQKIRAKTAKKKPQHTLKEKRKKKESTNHLHLG